MKDLSFISEELRMRSRSNEEIVLPYEFAVEAVGQLREQSVALLGWEGLVVAADGTVPFSGTVRGTSSIDRESDETWDAYVKRSSDFCLQTMKHESQRFRASTEAKIGELYYCLVPIADRSACRVTSDGRKTKA